MIDWDEIDRLIAKSDARRDRSPELPGHTYHCVVCDAAAPAHPVPGWGDEEDDHGNLEFLCPRCRLTR